MTSVGPKDQKAAIEEKAKEYGHKPVWSGNFCQCEKPGCGCKAFADPYRGIIGGTLLSKQCQT